MQTHPDKLVVVNADDFGFSPEITDGILKAHCEGIVTSTTVTTNMPYAAEAVARLPEAPSLGVGVHLNICQGPPLSSAGRRLAGADGLLNLSAVRAVFTCATRPWLLDAVQAEFDAQIRRLLDWGVRPTHLDSHRHIHAFGPVFARVLRLARRYDIRAVRRCVEALPGRGWPAAEARQTRVAQAVSSCFRAGEVLVGDARECLCRGLWGVAHTGRIDADWLLTAARRVRCGPWEIMTHPSAGGPVRESRLGECRRRELEALCRSQVRQAFEANGVRLVHYGQLTHLTDAAATADERRR
ncbi:MAG: carbohydrate deacetylase [Phycisphaerae bacterium]